MELKPLNQSDFKMKLIRDIGMVYESSSSKSKCRAAIFECSRCKKHIQRRVSHAKDGGTECRQCSCKTHGMTDHKFYKLWKGQRGRCRNVSNPDYPDYGGRGITFHSYFDDFTKWLDYISKLDNYDKLQDKRYSIDRIDNNKGYEPGNLRITSWEVQSTNKRKQKTNKSGYVGVFKTKPVYTAYITVNRKHHHIGSFETAEEAVIARNNYILDNNLPHKLTKL